METLRLHLIHLLSFYGSFFLKIKRFPIIVPIIEFIMSLYFKLSCNIVQCTVDLDDHTTMHLWAPAHRRFNKPNLVMIHGYGGNSKWQFINQVGPLAKAFNLYFPELLFFGKSYTMCSNRTTAFHVKCMHDGLKGLGVERCLVCSVSYGGYMGYQMAENYPKLVEKIVTVSSRIGHMFCEVGSERNRFLVFIEK